MIDRKPLLWFLGIAFVFSWAFFLAPLALPVQDPLQKRGIMLACFALAMFGPGLAAIIVTVVVSKQPFKSLRLNTLGPRRFYLWAWFLFPVLTLLSLPVLLVLGFGDFDQGLTLIRQGMAAIPAGTPAWVVLAAQIGFAFLVAPVIPNALFGLGEELGWRGFLLPRLLPLGQWKAILLSGAIWGFWHAPAILQGQNYPGHPFLGVVMMIVACMLCGTLLSWLALETRSPWVAALGHGALNASAGLPVLFLKPGVDFVLGGTLFSLAGWIVMAVFIAWLVWSRRLPVSVPEQETARA